MFNLHFNLKNSNCECVLKLKYTRNLFYINVLSRICKIRKNFLLILHEGGVNPLLFYQHLLAVDNVNAV